MDLLPEEVFINILPHIGGIDFLNLRRSCWRLKTICDNLEMSSRPLLWCRFVFQDFPPPLVELSMPCKPEEDEISWKKFYVQLWNEKRMRKGINVVTSILTTEEEQYYSELVFKG
ncbi:hypothetical protein EGW08_007510, partial [Elysia chlorotica]